jgi:PIN domain nuclease of toxin-antitoxin system
MREAIRDPENDVWLSVVSVWEIVVKTDLGRLPLPARPWPYVRQLRERHGISSLSLDESAIAHLDKLPAVHRDPFDRMLVCQAIQHELEIATSDDVVQRYPVKTVWLDET